MLRALWVIGCLVNQKKLLLIIILKVVLQTRSPNYVVQDVASDYVVLVDEKLGLVKKISFGDSSYELSVLDESLTGVEGKIFAGLYRTMGKP